MRAETRSRFGSRCAYRKANLSFTGYNQTRRVGLDSRIASVADFCAAADGLAHFSFFSTKLSGPENRVFVVFWLFGRNPPFGRDGLDSRIAPPAGIEPAAY